MTPDAFVSMWNGPLVRLPPGAPAPAGIDPYAWEFLRDAGLPRTIVYGETQGPGTLTFKSLKRGLLSFASLPSSLRLGEEDFPDHVIIGMERYEGGSSPLWCLHVPSGRVEVLDPEADELKLRIANTSVPALAATLVALRSWASSTSGSEELAHELEVIDPIAYSASVWAMLVSYLASTGATTMQFQVPALAPV